jgi:hypothetical protein
MGTHCTGEVSTVIGIFDLDHLGTLVCKKLRAKGACAVLFDCQNTETCKRKGHDGLLVFQF